MAASRLVQYERKQALKSAVIYIVLTALVLFVITRFGTAVVTSVTGLFGQEPSTNATTESSVVAPPQIEPLPEITNQSVLTIHGTATAGSTVRLTLNGQKQDIVTNAQGNWDVAFSLHEGENSLRAQSVDGNGNTSREVSQTLSLDKTNPKLEMHEPQEGASKSGKKELTLVISGTTDADASVKINDRVAIVSGTGDFSLSFNLNEGENQFLIVSIDRAGNKTEETRTVTYTP